MYNLSEILYIFFSCKNATDLLDCKNALDQLQGLQPDALLVYNQLMQDFLTANLI